MMTYISCHKAKFLLKEEFLFWVDLPGPGVSLDPSGRSIQVMQA